ncbi:hypothetical protein, partial [Mameliella alba]|uniref:hypothetical protein n=1 Tax=Mameliella alba TaxID=561184 RepID=UPI001A9C778F
AQTNGNQRVAAVEICQTRVTGAPLTVFCLATSLLRTCVKADAAQRCWNAAIQLVTILAQSAQQLPRQIRLVLQIKRYKRSFSLRNLGKSAKY